MGSEGESNPDEKVGTYGPDPPRWIMNLTKLFDLIKKEKAALLGQLLLLVARGGVEPPTSGL